MTTSQDLLDCIVAALLGPGAGASSHAYATAAGDQVYQPGDWPTQSDQYPIIKARLLTEQKQGWGRGTPGFTVTSTIRLIVEVSQPVLADNAGATAAEKQLWSIVRQVEVAIINSYPLAAIVSQVASVSTTLAFTSEAATHLAGANIDLALEFAQGPEDFAPINAEDLAGADAAATGFPGLATHIQLA